MAEQVAPASDGGLDERSHFTGVRERCAGTIQGHGQAAERLGLRPSTLRHRMRKAEHPATTRPLTSSVR